MIFRNRTPSEYVGYGLYFYFYFSGLSLRKAAEIDYQIALSKETMFPFGIGFKSTILKKYPHQKKENLFEYYCIQKDETVIKVGSEYIWIWVATIELESKEILRISISKEQNMFLLLLNDLFRML